MALSAIGIFVAGHFFGAPIERLGESAAKLVIPDDQVVLIAACAPLRDARTIIKWQRTDGIETILADKQIDYMNETSVIIQNISNKAIKSGFLTVYAFGIRDKDPKPLFTKMLASSLAGSESYKVERSSGSYRISIPVFNPKEVIVLDTYFSVPVGFLVELFADGISEKDGFEPGCKHFPTIKLTLPRLFFEYYSDKCKKPEDVTKSVQCDFESASLPFTITQEMQGKTLLVEDRILKD